MCERSRLRVGGNAELDEALADGLGKLVPGVLPVLAVVEALPAMPGGLRLLQDGVEERDEELGGWKRR